IFGEDICNQIPGCVGEFIPLCHLGLLALMAVYFTENRISWVYEQSLAHSRRRGNQLGDADDIRCPV
ncbi:hypothetical protein, partial [Pseudomonas helleri]|uniref:hypothetical protein n=1 Tax=Pseudomonas helleri TaxID=1608996 RepID=UPI0019D3BCEE